ncbi:MAG: hypothetical protein M1836_000438 [Candelina mexicana]|nr:MAG: hypothetical protein M1836_000438 [Candelina mexicana]
MPQQQNNGGPGGATAGGQSGAPTQQNLNSIREILFKDSHIFCLLLVLHPGIRIHDRHLRYERGKTVIVYCCTSQPTAVSLPMWEVYTGGKWLAPESALACQTEGLYAQSQVRTQSGLDVTRLALESCNGSKPRTQHICNYASSPEGSGPESSDDATESTPILITASNNILYAPEALDSAARSLSAMTVSSPHYGVLL